MIEIMNAISWQVVGLVAWIAFPAVLILGIRALRKTAREARLLKHDENMANMQIQNQKNIENRRGSS